MGTAFGIYKPGLLLILTERPTLRYGWLLPLLTGCNGLPISTGTGGYFGYRNVKVDGIKNEFDEQRTQNETA